jgi:hypothetical protein
MMCLTLPVFLFFKRNATLCNFLEFHIAFLACQVVLTTIELTKNRPDLSYDAYEYTVSNFCQQPSSTNMHHTLLNGENSEASADSSLLIYTVLLQAWLLQYLRTKDTCHNEQCERLRHHVALHYRQCRLKVLTLCLLI